MILKHFERFGKKRMTQKVKNVGDQSEKGLLTFTEWQQSANAQINGILTPFQQQIHQLLTES
jgi:hypothetical protein